MTTLLERGARWLRGKLPGAAAVTIELRTPYGVMESLEAIPGSRNYEVYAAGDAIGTTPAMDWIVAEAALVFPAVGKKEPEKGWEFRYRREDETVAVYVAEPESGTRCFDVLDQLGMMLRVHTKLDHIERKDVVDG